MWNGKRQSLVYFSDIPASNVSFVLPEQI